MIGSNKASKGSNTSSSTTEIREATIARLNEEKIPFLETLPIINIETETLREKEEVVQRLIAIIITSAKAFGCPEDELSDFLKKFESNITFSPNELDYLNNENPSDQDNSNFSWRIEAGKMLLWSLGFTSEYGSCQEQADLNVFWELIANNSYDELVEKAKMRTKEEILQLLDYVYNVHWALVEVRLGNMALPATLEGDSTDIVPEWHYGLNWLTCYDDADWDDVSIDT